MPSTVNTKKGLRGSKKDAFLRNDENAAPAKGKKGSSSQKNPNKKKGKKPTLKEKQRRESELFAATKRAPLGALNDNVGGGPESESPEPANRTVNRFAVLEGLDIDRSPSPASTKESLAASPKQCVGRTLLDVLELIGDFSYIEVLALESVTAPAVDEGLPQPEAVEEVQPVVVEEIVIAAVEEVERKPDGIFIKASRFVGKVVATVAAAAVAVVSVVRRCF